MKKLFVLLVIMGFALSSIFAQEKKSGAPDSEARKTLAIVLQKINDKRIKSIDDLSSREQESIRLLYNKYFSGIRLSGFLRGQPEHFDDQLADAFGTIAKLCKGKSVWFILDLFGKPVGVVSMGEGFALEYKVKMNRMVMFICSLVGTVKTISVGTTGYVTDKRTGGAVSVHDHHHKKKIKKKTEQNDY